VHNKKGQLII